MNKKISDDDLFEKGLSEILSNDSEPFNETPKHHHPSQQIQTSPKEPDKKKQSLSTESIIRIIALLATIALLALFALQITSR